ncbi:MAG: SEC-C metal-binding domain-containing protein, partial [Acidimicrobiales bacterium]
RALRAAFDSRHVEGVGMEPDELVLDALCHDPSLFRSPVAPIGELLERAGLERRGAWFGQNGEDWEPPGVRYLERERAELRETWAFNRCCDEAFEAVREVWRGHVLHESDPATTDLRRVARALEHGSVAPAFAQYVLGSRESGSVALASFAAELSQLPGKLAAPGLYLRAVEAERDGRAIVAESDLQSSVRADPEYSPALEELAWYVAERGDARRAISLLRRAGAPEDHPELDYLMSRLDTAPRASVGRNDRCPCGSGRKFKACCLDNPSVPIEARAGWLYHKIVTFGLRPPRKEAVKRLVDIVGEEAPSSAMDQLLPMLVDMAAMEDDVIERFLDERGDLLPPDERVLARSWVGSQLSLWEVVGLDPGSAVILRDTGTGDRLTVTERSASKNLHLGGYLLARVVAAGSQHQIVGLPLRLELRHRQSLIELLDSDHGAEDLAAWLGAAFAPPRMTNREGEETVLCRARLRIRTTSWDELSAMLDKRFGEANDKRWTETTTVDGETVVRCFLRRQGDELVVETNSVERFDRLLSTLKEEVAADLVVIEEERLPATEMLARHETNRSSGSSESKEMPPEISQAVHDLLRQKEDAWLEESVPALGGLTPRQAVSDPTRREDLVALLREFEHHDERGSGMVSFDVARLRKRLGLSDEPPSYGG